MRCDYCNTVDKTCKTEKYYAVNRSWCECGDKWRNCENAIACLIAFKETNEKFGKLEKFWTITIRVLSLAIGVIFTIFLARSFFAFYQNQKNVMGVYFTCTIFLLYQGIKLTLFNDIWLLKFIKRRLHQKKYSVLRKNKRN